MNKPTPEQFAEAQAAVTEQFDRLYNEPLSVAMREQEAIEIAVTVTQWMNAQESL